MKQCQSSLCFVEVDSELKVVCTYFSGSLGLNVGFEDLLGPGGQPEGMFDLLKLLTDQPKLQVFIAEL